VNGPRAGAKEQKEKEEKEEKEEKMGFPASPGRAGLLRIEPAAGFGQDQQFGIWVDDAGMDDLCFGI